MSAFKKHVACLAFFSLFTAAKLFAASGFTVYIFMSEACPICQSATLELKNLYTEYHSKGVAFVGIFPNADMSTDVSIAKFGKKYNLDFPLKRDEAQQWVKEFSATVTPQVFVVNEANKEVVYRGRINNGFERVGKKRQVITEFYLKNALEDVLANRPVAMKETEPVGCFIIKK